MTTSLQSTCPHCTGTGKVKLSKPLADCARAIQKLGTATLAQIHAASRIKGTDMTSTNQRIYRLIEKGLVERIESGERLRFRMVNGD